MRLTSSLLACTACAIAAHSSVARTIGARRTVGLGMRPAKSLETLESLHGDASSIEVNPQTHQLKELSQDDRGLDALFSRLEDTENIGTIKVAEGPDSNSNSNSNSERSTPSSESDSNDSDEQDLMSPPTPISEGRRRAGILGILGAMCASSFLPYLCLVFSSIHFQSWTTVLGTSHTPNRILTTALVYHLYTRRARLYEYLSSLPERFPSLTNLNLKWLPLSLPTLSLPALSAPQRTRRRRLRRTKGGFRPHVSRLRAWAAETDVGLLNDYDTEYDGDYERGHASSGSTSSSSSLEAGRNEAFDLGADEDFMIGAPRRGSDPSSGAASSASGKAARGVGRVWGRLKGTRASKSSTSNSNTKRNGNGTVLFAVAEGDDLDFDLDDDGMERETDEALPLAPSPYRFGSGSVKGYGSAS